MGGVLLKNSETEQAQARELLAMLLLFVKVRSTRSHSNLLAEGAREVLGGDPQNIRESDLAVCTNLCV